VCDVSRQPVRAEEDAADVHALPDAGAGEGIPLQPLPDPASAHRDRAPAPTHRAPGQDLVPEPAHEVEEGEQCDQVDRTRRLR